MDQAYGEGPKGIPILGSGSKEKLMVMAFILGSLEIDMRDSLRTV